MTAPKVKFKSAPRYYDYQEVTKNLATTLPHFYHYRPPQIKRTNGKIYIEYWYRVPADLREHNKNKEWERIRLRDDINRRKDNREAYAEWLRSYIETLLKEGYNPFKDSLNIIEKDEEQKELTATDALILFLDTWNKKGLEKHTIEIYTKVVRRFLDWLGKKKIPYTNIVNITTNHIETFLQDAKKEYGFGNREYNNHRNFLRTAFLWLKSKKRIADNPFVGIEKLKAPATKHRFFDDKNLSAITKAMEIEDTYLLLAFKTVYYGCIRSEKELKNLRVGNISFDQNKVLIEVSKGKSEDYIPLDQNLKELFLKHGINNYPDDHFVFGINRKPSPNSFGKGFFSKRFKKLRELIGLSEKFSIYGAKHTRVIHLKQDGATDADIMSLTRHKDFSAYAKYLRDIGLSADAAKINKLSRKI